MLPVAADEPFAVPGPVVGEEAGGSAAENGPFGPADSDWQPEAVGDLFAADEPAPLAPGAIQAPPEVAAEPWGDGVSTGFSDTVTGARDDESTEVDEDDLFVDREPPCPSPTCGGRGSRHPSASCGAGGEVASQDVAESPGDDRVVMVGEGDPFADPFEAEPSLHAPERVRAAGSAVLGPARGSALRPSVAGVEVLPGDNQLHVRLEGTGALAESGQVRELDIVVPVPGGWIGNRRVTLQLRLTLTPATESSE